MVKFLRAFALAGLVAGSGQAACPDAILNKTCTDDHVGARRACLADLKRQLSACIPASDATIKGADRKVTDAMKAKRDAALGALEADKGESIEDGRKVDSAFNSFQSTISDIKSEYASFTKEFFQDYKANENTSSAKLEKIAKRLNADTIGDLVEAQYAAIDVARTEQDLAFQNVGHINLLTFKAHYLEDGLGKEFVGLESYLKAKNLADFEHPFDEILPSLDKMASYVQQRRQRYQKMAADLDQAFVVRLEAVKLKNVDAAIGDSLKLAAALNASAQFMGEVEDARVAAFATPPKSSIYGVPPYGPQYLALQKFYAYSTICGSQNTPSWAKSGCLRYAQYADNAKRLYIGVGLSQSCIQNIPAIMAVNPQIPDSLFTRMKDLHAQKKFPDVIALYDSILKIERKP